MSLYDAARAMGVPFTQEARPVSRNVQANGLRFHYLEWGHEDRPTILLLHGFAQTAHSWDFVALSLCPDYRVIALDQRGHGDSQWASDGDYSLEAYVADLEAVTSALDLRDLVLVGLSMGGRNSLAFAARHPERLRALVLVDSAPEMQRPGTQRIRRFVQAEDELDSVEDFVRRAHSYNPLRPIEQIRGSIVHNLRQLPNGKWTWKYDKALRSPGGRFRATPEAVAALWRAVETVSCPALMVRGAESNVVSQETAERVAALLPRGRLAVVEKAGHLVPGDNPAAFIRVLSDFLQEVTS